MAKNSNSTNNGIINKLNQLISSKGIVMIADEDSITVDNNENTFNVKVIYNKQGVQFDCDGDNDNVINTIIDSWAADLTLR